MDRKIIYIIKEQRYIGFIFKYGIVTVLLLLEEHEQEENFEECEIIYKAVKYCNDHLKATTDYEQLPTRYAPDSLLKLKKEFNLFGFKGDNSINNIPHYIEDMKKEILLISK